MRRRSMNRAHALRVAIVAALLLAGVYVAVAAVFDAVVVHRLVTQVDARLSDRLRDAAGEPAQGLGRSTVQAASPTGDRDVDAAPVFLWRVDRAGRVVAAEAGAPALGRVSWLSRGGPVTAALGSSTFRLDATRAGSGWWVAGISLAEQRHLEGTLVVGEAVAGPAVVLATFLAALVIGVQASAPVEQARRRQLEFTADASHELRTPLSVIEAEVALALRSPRDAARYRESIERVGRESARLLRIVEDLLWLARFDSTPPPPVREPVDLSTIAEGCAERFRSVAAARGIVLTVERRGTGPAWVHAPPEWIDRLAGVLVDNACRYAPDGGTARVMVETRSGRVALVVEDSGPGIPPDERARLFDRFHRASDAPGGTGLGLAIADSVVRSTGGRWHVGDSPLGGALLEVRWHRSGRDRAVPDEPDDGAVPSGRQGSPAGLSPRSAVRS